MWVKVLTDNIMIARTDMFILIRDGHILRDPSNVVCAGKILGGLSHSPRLFIMNIKFVLL